MKKTYFAPAAVVVSMLVLSATRAGAQGPPNPCCAIVAVDAATGIATAKITADGRVFQFKPKNPAVTTLQPGQPVYANFGKAQVSVDGRTVCCEITSAPQAAMAAAGGRPVQQPAAVPPTISAAPPAAVAPTISAPSPAAPERAPAGGGGVCCEIVAVDATTGVVTAKVNANGNLFGFKPGNPASVKLGQAVYVNFTSHQVSLDGRTVCCLMMGDPQPAAVAAATPERVVPVPTATTPSASGPMNSLTVGTRATSASAIDPSRPTISYGTPRLVDAQHPRDVMELRPVTMRMAGRDASTKVLRLRGLAGIEQTQDLPEGAKRLLQIHVRAL
ncbi:MAG TPA: hypothetical protein VGO75_14510, partial [Gemmatimonadaceae bacterium]|nr:hypothetical protein [Gemmatimonadaceae bacterium]